MKNCQEWLLAFNQAYDNIMSRKAPGLNPYEISVFLTDAQENIVMGLYNGSFGKPFESEEDVSNFLSTLMRQTDMVEVKDGGAQEEGRAAGGHTLTHTCPGSRIYTLPEGADEILVKTFESCDIESDCTNARGEKQYSQAIVVPVTQDEFWRTRRNPFKRDNACRVLRLTYPSSPKTCGCGGTMTVEKYTELVSDRDIGKYTVKYITRPEPIILADLRRDVLCGGLSIRGRWKAQTCLLDDAIHPMILSEAVRAAKAAWQN